jgi:hypothetical protein
VKVGSMTLQHIRSGVLRHYPPRALQKILGTWDISPPAVGNDPARR